MVAAFLFGGSLFKIVLARQYTPRIGGFSAVD
jgi:hypothetical protein